MWGAQCEWLRPRMQWLRAASAAVIVFVSPVRAILSLSGPPFSDSAACDYFIVAPDHPGILKEIRRLAEYKRRKGLRTRIATIDSIAEVNAGEDLQQKVRNALRAARRDLGAVWVLLVGDHHLLPAREVFDIVSGRTVLSDIYYACLDSGWQADNLGRYGTDVKVPGRVVRMVDPDGATRERYVPPVVEPVDLGADVCIGRLPVATAHEAGVLVDKILRYSTGADRGAGADRVFLYGTLVSGRQWTPDSTSMVSRASYLWHYQVAPLLAQSSSPFAHLEVVELHEDRVLPGGHLQGDSIPIAPGTVLSHFSEGYNLLFFAAHGSPREIVVSSASDTIPVLSINQIKTLRSPSYSNVMSISCNVMKLDSSTCFAKEFLVNPDGGAVSYVGSSGLDFFTEKRRQVVSAVDALSGEKTDRLFRAFQVAAMGPRTHEVRWNLFVTQYWGDPEMWVRTRSMGEEDRLGITARHQSGAVDVSVEPSLDSVLVCMYRRGAVMCRAYTRSGELSFDTPPAGVDTVYLTATRQGYLPRTIGLTRDGSILGAARRTVRGREAWLLVSAPGGRLQVGVRGPAGKWRAWLYGCKGRVVAFSSPLTGTAVWRPRVAAAGIYVLRVFTSSGTLTRSIHLQGP